MDSLFGLVAAGLRRLRLKTAALMGALLGPSARQAALWREAARVAGLGSIQEWRGGLSGWAGPLRVRMERFADSGSRGTRITVSGHAMPSGLTVRPEGLVTAMRGARGVREVETGHDVFDAAAWVEGDASLAQAVLGAANRQALRALFDGRLERPGRSPFWVSGRVDDGVLRLDVPDSFPGARGRTLGERREPGDEPGGSIHLSAPDHLGEVLSRAIALARRLATPADVPRRLADNLKIEPVAGVRVQLLATLAREFPDEPTTREALLTAREDLDAEVRLRAGMTLGPDGRDVLLAIAGGEGATDETTQRAVTALGVFLTADAAQRILRNALRTRRLATARACVEALGRRGGTAAVADLGRVIAVETGELAYAAARALAMTRDPAAEAPLLRALAGGDRGLRLAAAMALGRVGTVAAVGPLREAEAGDAEMRRTARQAIAEIQSRVAGAAPGQLSLAGGESGALSLVEEGAGQLSLACHPEELHPSRATKDPLSPEPEPADPSGPGRRGPSG